MTYDDILDLIRTNAEKHRNVDDLEDAELYEYEIERVIRDYCMSKRYEVNGFPFKLTENDIDIEDHYELWDSSVFEAYKQYIDRLALEKDDVGELMWNYTKAFWPDEFESKSECLETTKELLDSGAIYEFKL